MLPLHKDDEQVGCGAPVCRQSRLYLGCSAAGCWLSYARRGCICTGKPLRIELALYPMAVNGPDFVLITSQLVGIKTALCGSRRVPIR